MLTDKVREDEEGKCSDLTLNLYFLKLIKWFNLIFFSMLLLVEPSFPAS
jgi:hypothetical protein